MQNACVRGATSPSRYTLGACVCVCLRVSVEADRSVDINIGNWTSGTRARGLVRQPCSLISKADDLWPVSRVQRDLLTSFAEPKRRQGLRETAATLVDASLRGTLEREAGVGTRRAEEAACDSHANGNGHNGKVILFDWSASDAGHIEFLLWIGGRTSHCGSRCNRCSRPLVANRLFPSFLGSVKEGSFKFFLLVGLRRCWKEQRSGLLGPRGVLATFV